MTNSTLPAKKHTWRNRLLMLGLLLIGIVWLILWWRYYKAYSEGERIGKDLKISTRGDVFKTCEGYFTEGCRDVLNNSNTFAFSVSDSDVEEQLKKLQLEPNTCVYVRYVQTNHALPWRGESVYMIVEAKRLEP